MWDFILKAVGWIIPKRRDPVEGFDKLTGRLGERLDSAEQRLDDCERDRDDMRSEIRTLKDEVSDCNQDRRELRERIENLEERTQTQ